MSYKIVMKESEFYGEDEDKEDHILLFFYGLFEIGSTFESEE